MVPESPNRLLASLGGQGYRKLLPKLATMFVRSGEPLAHCGHTRVYFPGDALCSMRSVMRDGRVIEVATVGREGVAGYPVTHAVAPMHTYMQVADAGIQYMLTDDFHRAIAQSDVLKDAVDRYSQRLLQETIQASVCLRAHTLDKRCARWLLVAREKIGRNRFEAPRKAVAGALGVTVKKLSIVLRQFVRQGAIELDGDMLTFVDAEKLEHAACYCYRRRARTVDPSTERMTPVSTAGKIVRLVPDIVCERCQLGSGLPHASEHDCMRALDRELRDVHIRHIDLVRKRHDILEQRLKVLRDFVRRMKKTGANPAEELGKLTKLR